MSVLKDETGNRYGLLTVIRKAPTDGAPAARWVCRCDCGAVRVILGVHLRDPKRPRKSCGCARAGAKRTPASIVGSVPVRPHGTGYRYDLTGKRFGSYVVLGFSHRQTYPSGAQQAMWDCRCDCGVEKPVAYAHLVHNGIQSCSACFVGAGKVPEQERVCRWCGRQTRAVVGSRPRECAACERMAIRNGRCRRCSAPQSVRFRHECGKARQLDVNANKPRPARQEAS